MRCFVRVLLTILSVLSSQRAVASPAHCFLRWELRLARRWREVSGRGGLLLLIGGAWRCGRRPGS